MTSIASATARDLAEAWLRADPDPTTSVQTRALLEADGPELDAVVGTNLSFGTAGLRGPMRTGPSGMNRVLVRLAAAAVADTSLAGDFGSATDPHIVVGFDARHGSAAFAADTARVALAGVRCTLLPALRHRSWLSPSPSRRNRWCHGHRQPQSANGQRLQGVRIGREPLRPPVDAAIAARMESLPLLHERTLRPRPISPERRCSSARTSGRSPPPTATVPAGVVVAHTALMGSGRPPAAAFACAGFDAPSPRSRSGRSRPGLSLRCLPQSRGAGDTRRLAGAGRDDQRRPGSANDPDADRLAVAIPDRGAWRLLSGDQVGCLLADHLLRQPCDDHRPALVVNTVTSSGLLGRIAARYDAAHATTLTGFKWIMASRRTHPEHRLVVGYEEALGYAVNPAVRDKDGISAALAITDLAAELQATGQTIADRLEELETTHSAGATGQRAIRVAAVADQVALMSRLRDAPPTDLAGEPVTRVVDLLDASGPLPPTDGLVFELDEARITVRPSGTEPKTKVYGEASSRSRVRALIGATASGVALILALPVEVFTKSAPASAAIKVAVRIASVLGSSPLSRMTFR